MTKTRLIVFALAVMATVIALGSVVAAATGRFSDVPDDHYAATEIGWAAGLGIINGCGDGSEFCPDSPLTRAHLAAMLYRYHYAVGCDLAAPVEPIQFRLGDSPSDTRRWKRHLTAGAYTVEVHWTEAVYVPNVRVSARGGNLVELIEGSIILDHDDNADPWTDLTTLVVMDDPDDGEVESGDVKFRVSGLDGGDGFVSGRLEIVRAC